MAWVAAAAVAAMALVICASLVGAAGRMSRAEEALGLVPRASHRRG